MNNYRQYMNKHSGNISGYMYSAENDIYMNIIYDKYYIVDSCNNLLLLAKHYFLKTKNKNK